MSLLIEPKQQGNTIDRRKVAVRRNALAVVGDKGFEVEIRSTRQNRMYRFGKGGTAQRAQLLCVDGDNNVGFCGLVVAW